ncbi:MAG TPA: hypothetical protein ENN67_05565 [Firmicutes bacterium]|nr:hypothetical protein [Bacillota bacterium]
MQVWEVANPQPRVFLTRRVAFASDPSDNPLVQAANWNVKGIDVVIVEDPSGENRTFAFPDAFETDEPFYLPEGNIEIIKEEPENLILIYNALKECYIILRDGWFPEWRAYIDGEETEIFPADMAFRAVRVPSGEHRVEFRYEPASFITGSRITILTLILCVLMIFFGNKRLFNKLINRQGS